MGGVWGAAELGGRWWRRVGSDIESAMAGVGGR